MTRDRILSSLLPLTAALLWVLGCPEPYVTDDDDDTYDDDDDGDDDDASTTTLPDDTLRVGSGCGCDTTARPFRGGLLGVMLLAALSRRRR